MVHTKTVKNTATRKQKIKEIEKVIAKVKNAMANNWAVKKTLKKKRNQIGKQILQQRQKELNDLKKLQKKIQFTEESAVRFFKKNDPPTENTTRKNNTRESTANNTRGREGRYTASKTRTKRVLKDLNNVKQYVNKTRALYARERPKIEAQWARKMFRDELAESENAFVKSLQKSLFPK